MGSTLLAPRGDSYSINGRKFQLTMSKIALALFPVPVMELDTAMDSTQAPAVRIIATGVAVASVLGGKVVSAAAEGETVLSRLITSSNPAENFMSNAAKGLAPRGPEVANPALHQGLSMFDSVEGAAAKVPVLERGGHRVLGIAEVRIPSGAAGVDKTLGPGHYTVTGGEETLQGFWNYTITNW